MFEITKLNIIYVILLKKPDSSKLIEAEKTAEIKKWMNLIIKPFYAQSLRNSFYK